MKRLLFYLLLLPPCFGTVFSFVQGNNVTNTSSVACAGSVTAGNVLMLIGGGFDSTAATGATDTFGDTFTQVGQTVTGIGGVYVFETIAKSSGSNTITVAGAGTTNMVLICAEYAAPSKFLITRESFVAYNINTANTYTVTFPFATISTPTVPSEVMAIVVFYDEQTAHSWTMSNGTKRLDTNPGGGTAFLWGDYDTTSSPLSTVIGTFATNGDTTAVTTFLTVFPSGGGGSNPVGFVSQ